MDIQRLFKPLPGLFLIRETRQPSWLVAASDACLQVAGQSPDIVRRSPTQRMAG